MCNASKLAYKTASTTWIQIIKYTICIISINDNVGNDRFAKQMHDQKAKYPYHLKQCNLRTLIEKVANKVARTP